MKKRLLLIGSGGHFRSVIDSLDMDAFSDIAILDNARPVGEKVVGIPVIGVEADASRLYNQGYTHAFIALGSTGNPALRISLYQIYIDLGYHFPTIIDKTAIVSKNAVVGEGVFIGKGAIVNIGVRLRECCIVNTGAIIDHDCDIGAFVHIGPGARLSGGISIGSNSHIGVGSSIIQSIDVGENTVIGAGSVVVSNIPSGVIAVGAPCKTIKSKER